MSMSVWRRGKKFARDMRDVELSMIGIYSTCEERKSKVCKLVTQTSRGRREIKVAERCDGGDELSFYDQVEKKNNE